MGDHQVSEPQRSSKTTAADAHVAPEEPTITYQESTASQTWLKWNWKSTKPKDGDTAMALFDDPDELHEEIDPAEERRILWKIDFMILPYLAVCYAFFYIDKVSRQFFLWIGSLLMESFYRQP